MRCLLGFHRWGLMRSYRFSQLLSNVLRPACERCGTLRFYSGSRG